MDFEIDVQAETVVYEPYIEKIKTAVISTLHQQFITPPAAITIVLTDDKTIRQLNRDYRATDAPTDVLSFSAGDSMPGMEAVYLGDIIISVPFAVQQAVVSGHPTIAELQLLAVHGTLHLLGHDHASEQEKKVMWAAQAAVLTTLHLPHINPTEAAH